MKKIMSRGLVLVGLLTCLGLVSAIDFRTNAQNPPCPINCHNDCRAVYDDCVHECNDEDCVGQCQKNLNRCLAYCDWVCGPE